MKTDRGVIGYPGSGAAHPHWQFDVDAGWIDPMPEPDGAEQAIDIELEPRLEEIDLLDEVDALVVAAPPPRRLSATLAGFHHLHLPARTMWHELLCEMPDVATPHQHTPRHEDEVDRWVVSALRYVRSEFQGYM